MSDRRGGSGDGTRDVGLGATLGPMPNAGRSAPRHSFVPSDVVAERIDTPSASPSIPSNDPGHPPPTVSSGSNATRLGRELRAARDELIDARAVALSGMESHAELVWLRRDLMAQRERAAHYQRESSRRERESTEKDDRVRERLRKLGLWRLMGRLRLEIELGKNSKLAMKTWLDAVRRRRRMEGRAVGGHTGTKDTHTPDRHVVSKNHGNAVQNPDNTLSDDEPGSSSDDGEPGTHRWRSAKKKKRRKSSGIAPSESDTDSVLSRSTRRDDDDDDESIMSYSTLASTAFDGDGNDNDTSSVVSADEGHGSLFAALKTPGDRKNKRSYSTAPTAAPGLRAADLAQLARAAPPPSLGGVGSEAVLAWRERAASAAAELEQMSAARFEAEEALRRRRREERLTRSKTAEAEEVLRGEIEALRNRVHNAELKHKQRLELETTAHIEKVSLEIKNREKLAQRLKETESAREQVEGELRGLQMSTRDAARESARLAAAAAIMETDEVKSLREKLNALQVDKKQREEDDSVETAKRVALELDVQTLRLEAEKREIAWREKLGQEQNARCALEKAHVELRETSRVTNDELEALRDKTRAENETLEKELEAVRLDKDAAELAAREATNTSRVHRDEVAEAVAERVRDLEVRLLESRREMLASERAWRERLAVAEMRSAAAVATATTREETATEAVAKAAAADSAAAAVAEEIRAARADAVKARNEAALAEAAVAEASTSFETKTHAERLALETTAAEARAAMEKRESSLREALDEQSRLRTEAEFALREATQTSRVRETSLEDALRDARERERSASEARLAAANALAAKESELADTDSLRAAAATEAELLRVAESALCEKLDEAEKNAELASNSMTSIQKEKDDIVNELTTLRETHGLRQRELDSLGSTHSTLRDENETLLRTQSETSRWDAAVLEKHKSTLREKEMELAELKKLKSDADSNAESWKQRTESTERELREMTMTQRATAERETQLRAEEAAKRQALMAEERKRVALLEEKLSGLDATFEVRVRKKDEQYSRQTEALQAQLHVSQAALAKAEVRMHRMARDLAEAEEELEQRDAAVEARKKQTTNVVMSTIRSIAEATNVDSNERTITAHVDPTVSSSSTTVDHQIFSKVRNNRHAEVEQLLKQPGFDANVTDKNGNTLLHVAAQNNRKRIAKAAVRAGTNLDSQNNKGNTAMHFAHAYGYDDVADYLVRKGASPTIVNEEGLRPDQGLTADRTL